MAKSDEILIVRGDVLETLAARDIRKQGLFGKKLEDALQTLIEKHPDVIPGKQIAPGDDDPPRFVLLHREMPVAGWYLDHLLVDQHGVLTLVEAKLLENSGSRREVIGQIMEYAANALESWGNGQARQRADEFWRQRGTMVDAVILDQFGNGVENDVVRFWNTVEENLRRGKIRLIIAADELRPEVRRIIEYLNEEMGRAEVYGLELRCYGEEPLVLVPYLIGRTQATADVKSKPGAQITWKTAQLRDAYDGLPDRPLGERLRLVLDWAVDRRYFFEAYAVNPTFGLRGRNGSRILTFLSDGTVYWFINDRYYTSRQERDALLAEMQRLHMVDPAFTAEGIVAGRNLVRNLMDLKEDELNACLEVFSRFCAGN